VKKDKNQTPGPNKVRRRRPAPGPPLRLDLGRHGQDRRRRGPRRPVRGHDGLPHRRRLAAVRLPLLVHARALRLARALALAPGHPRRAGARGRGGHAGEHLHDPGGGGDDEAADGAEGRAEESVRHGEGSHRGRGWLAGAVEGAAGEPGAVHQPEHHVRRHAAPARAPLPRQEDFEARRGLPCVPRVRPPFLAR
jgi:hypothetical protein